MMSNVENMQKMVKHWVEEFQILFLFGQWCLHNCLILTVPQPIVPGEFGRVHRIEWPCLWHHGVQKHIIHTRVLSPWEAKSPRKILIMFTSFLVGSLELPIKLYPNPSQSCFTLVYHVSLWTLFATLKLKTVHKGFALAKSQSCQVLDQWILGGESKCLSAVMGAMRSFLDI